MVSKVPAVMTGSTRDKLQAAQAAPGVLDCHLSETSVPALACCSSAKPCLTSCPLLQDQQQVSKDCWDLEVTVIQQLCETAAREACRCVAALLLLLLPKPSKTAAAIPRPSSLTSTIQRL